MLSQGAKFAAASACYPASALRRRGVFPEHQSAAVVLGDLFPHPYHLADAEAYIARVAPRDPPLSLSPQIEVGGHSVGGIGLEPLTAVKRRTAELGYWSGAAHWGRGVATEAVELVIDGHSMSMLFCGYSRSHSP
ncbi:MAG: GNAT family N-acetyltransferase [Pseudomonadota bacterium]|nr:GNAT family N-acetyltransferase [Pseudomonadota bacterium]